MAGEYLFDANKSLEKCKITERFFKIRYRNLLLILFNVFLIITVALWAIKIVNLQDLLSYLGAIPVQVVVYAIILNIVSFTFYGLRFRALTSASFLNSFLIVNFGAGANALYPFRIGDIARIYYAKKRFSISTEILIKTGLVEKFFDLIAVAILGLFAAIFSVHKFISLELVALLFAGIVICYTAFHILLKFVYCSGKYFAKIRGVLSKFNFFCRTLTLKEILTTSILTLFIWAINLLLIYVTLAGFLPEINFNFVDAICILVITALALAIPGAPAGLGVFEAAVVTYLKSVHGIEIELAIACGLVLHAAMLLPQLILMFVCIIKNKLFLIKSPT